MRIIIINLRPSTRLPKPCDLFFVLSANGLGSVGERSSVHSQWQSFDNNDNMAVPVIELRFFQIFFCKNGGRHEWEAPYNRIYILLYFWNATVSSIVFSKPSCNCWTTSEHGARYVRLTFKLFFFADPNIAKLKARSEVQECAIAVGLLMFGIILERFIEVLEESIKECPLASTSSKTSEAGDT